jgi:hypothetical protein
MPHIGKNSEVGKERPLNDNSIAKSKDCFVKANPDSETNDEERDES